MTAWSVEPCPRGDGVWFIAEDSGAVSAFAPPGVWLPTPASRTQMDRRLAGWRRASWPPDPELVLDIEPPIELSGVSTVDVCAQMPASLRNRVREVMIDQLHAALCLGRGRDGLVDDDAAQAGAGAAKWVIHELRAAFPDEEWLLPASIVELSDIPSTSDELLSALPKQVDDHHAAPVGREGRASLWFLLDALLRWLGNAFISLADWLMAKRQPDSSGEGHHEPETREHELVG